MAKRITKKLTEKAKRKECNELFPWIKSVSKHLWWFADTCEKDKNLLREKWISIVHHSANIHLWDSADLYHECPHPLIPREEARTKRWLRPGSPAHEALKEVVFDKTLLKDIEQLTLNCHTGSVPQCTTEVPFQAAALLIQGHGCSHTVSSPRSQR